MRSEVRRNKRGIEEAYNVSRARARQNAQDGWRERERERERPKKGGSTRRIGHARVWEVQECVAVWEVAQDRWDIQEKRSVPFDV